LSALVWTGRRRIDFFALYATAAGTPSLGHPVDDAGEGPA